jgi:hypothetical protein
VTASQEITLTATQDFSVAVGSCRRPRMPPPRRISSLALSTNPSHATRTSSPRYGRVNSLMTGCQADEERRSAWPVSADAAAGGVSRPHCGNVEPPIEGALRNCDERDRSVANDLRVPVG